MPPCLWGSPDDGLMPPKYLSYETNLLAVKKNNNTYTHYGEMASWQMRGILAKKKIKVKFTLYNLIFILGLNIPKQFCIFFSIFVLFNFLPYRTKI